MGISQYAVVQELQNVNQDSDILAGVDAPEEVKSRIRVLLEKDWLSIAERDELNDLVFNHCGV